MSLRPATPADLATVAALWARADMAMALPPPDPGEAEDDLAAGNLLVWAPGGRIAGFAALATWSAKSGTYGLKALAIDRQGQGEGGRFLAAILRLVFEDRRGHRLGLDVARDQYRAIALYQRAGFQQEGIFREAWLRPDGLYTDCLVMAMLAREWRARLVGVTG